MHALAIVDIALGVLLVVGIAGILMFIWRRSREEFKELFFIGWMIWLFVGWAPSIFTLAALPTVGLAMLMAYGASIIVTAAWYQS